MSDTLLIFCAAVNVHLGYEPAQVPGYCDSYLPNDSTYNRFLWFVNFLARNGAHMGTMTLTIQCLPRICVEALAGCKLTLNYRCIFSNTVLSPQAGTC